MKPSLNTKTSRRSGNALAGRNHEGYGETCQDLHHLHGNPYSHRQWLSLKSTLRNVNLRLLLVELALGSGARDGDAYVAARIAGITNDAGEANDFTDIAAKNFARRMDVLRTNVSSLNYESCDVQPPHVGNLAQMR